MSSVVGTGISSPPAQLVNTVQAIVQKFIAPVLGDQVLLEASLGGGRHVLEVAATAPTGTGMGTGRFDPVR